LIHVPEREVAELTSAAPAGIEVRFDALPGNEAIPARVAEFATETDRQTQTFPVTLELEGLPSTDLLPGMTASVTWITRTEPQHAGLMVAPLAAVGSDAAGARFVWRVDNETMTVDRVTVTTGALTDAGIEITAGLSAGDRILAAGVDFATQGQLVRPLDNEKE
jgi:RND family efflux transporter MFP subunit